MTLSNYLSKADQLTRHRHRDDADGNLLDDLQDLIDSAEDFLQATASYSGTEIEAARARVVSQLALARDHARKKRRSRAYRRVTKMAETSGRYVSEHKWQSASILAAAVALAGGVYAGLKLSDRGGRRR